MKPRTREQNARYNARRKEWQAVLPKIKCACGCGEMIPSQTLAGKPATYKRGHHPSRPAFPTGHRPWNQLGDEPLSPAVRTQRYRARHADVIIDGQTPRRRGAPLPFGERKTPTRAEREAMPKMPCQCGCGEMIPPVTALGCPARYKHGHQSGGEATRFQSGHRTWNKGKPYPRASEVHKGKVISKETIALINQVRRQHFGGAYSLAQTVMSTCPVCGDEFHNPASLHQKFCSNECRNFGLRGDQHPGWRGGVATLPYGPEFTRSFKRLIRKRDGNRCRRCGKTREQIGRTLQIHHLDHNKVNNDPANLVTSCNSCNVWASYHRDQPFITT